MRRIKLTKGRYATVDDWAYDALIAMGTWYKTGSGYAARTTRGSDGRRKVLCMHNEVMRLAGVKIPSGFEIDHRNMRKRDNRLSNLRLATRSQNNMNTRRRADNTSGFRGVTWCKRDRKWRAEIAVNGRRFSLGYFDSKQKAVTAYRQAARRHFGEFARAA